MQEELSAEDFEFFKTKIFELSGISMSSQKRDLIHARLRSYLNKQSPPLSFHDYREELASFKKGDPRLQAFINLLTTNKTEFFREEKHFNFLIQHMIPIWKNAQKTDVRIWCCASSTGEEASTLGMILDRHLDPSMSYTVLATDIDTEVLETARNGVYPNQRLNEIPIEYQRDSIVLGRGASEGWFKIQNRIFQNLHFAQHNLTDPLPSFESPFDAIFCRNVLIYFSPEGIRTLMEKLHRALDEQGILFIGHSESIASSQHLFQSINPSVYRKG